MKDDINAFRNLYRLQVLAKGFSVFYFVLLTVFYGQKLISTKQVGYIGALFIVMVILSALVVVRWLHQLETRRLLITAAVFAIAASVTLLAGSITRNVLLITIAFVVMGVGGGVGMSGVNAVAAALTKRGDRYKALAKLGMLTDIVRIVFPSIVAGAVLVGIPNAAIALVILNALLFLYFSRQVPSSLHQAKAAVDKDMPSIKINRSFQYVLSLEFLDSFSSSQLFVFLPLLFIAKGHTLESSLILQSCIFLGYLSGRWLVGYLARRSTGMRAIAYAEVGMVVTIVLILAVTPVWLLYILSIALGICARGTSPAIKALAFDTLSDEQMKQGSAVHVVAGDSGSALSQLFFGLLIAWYGVNTPFLVAAVIAALIAVLCFAMPLRLADHRHARQA